MFIVESLFVVTLLLSMSGTSSALLSDNMSTTDGEGRKSLDIVVTVAGVKGNCGEEVKITVAYQSDMFILCEGDGRPSEEQEQIL
jgi:hypothetical protein